MKTTLRIVARLTPDWLLVALLAAAASSFVSAQSVTVLHAFIQGTEGVQPAAGLTRGSDGRLYGTTQGGGPPGRGILFALNPDGSGFTVLQSFDDRASSTGASPNTALLKASDNKFYGITPRGGDHQGGTIFSLNGDGTGFTVLRHLNRAVEPAFPSAALVEGTDGRLYGTAQVGGTINDAGAIFSIQRDGSALTVLHRFAPPEGRFPSGLMEGSDGRLYGSTIYDGAYDAGTLFALNRDGTGFVVLHAFERATDGDVSTEGPIEASNGKLYGTASQGGQYGGGTVFSLNRDGSDFTVLHHLGADASDARLAKGALLQGSDERLYGTALTGGSHGYGAVFALDLDGTDFTVLRSFDAIPDGRQPTSSLLQGDDGTLYGITMIGGAYGTENTGSALGGGTIFALQPDGSGFTVLRHLSLGLAATGTSPFGGVIEGPDGRLYGTAAYGGAYGQGTVFSINRDGSDFTTLYHMSVPYGRYPSVAPIFASDGRLYGSASYGGTGTLFSLNPDGSDYTVLHHLDYATEGGSASALVEGWNGRLFGVSWQGGLNDNGTLFSLNPDGSGFNVLHDFEYWATGAYPGARLLLASDGRLYGTTWEGGEGGGGTVFSTDLDGADFSIAYHINEYSNITSPLIEDSNGRLYGAAPNGGAANDGWLFALNRDGSDFAVLHHFDYFGGTGTDPRGGLVEGFDGKLYGITANSAPPPGGPLLFALNRDGTGFTVLHHFDATTEGTYPSGPLIAASDGKVYGAMTYEGPYGAGTLFAISFPVQIVAQPASLSVGVNQAAVFTVGVIGSQAITYQWTHDGVLITGATAATLELPNVQLTDAGVYQVVVTNPLGSVTSADATLTVVGHVPVIVEQPQSQTVRSGKQAKFSVKATSPTPLSYQWQKNGADIPGATSKKLHLKKTTAADVGTYRVVISNASGSVTSDSVYLAVQ